MKALAIQPQPNYIQVESAPVLVSAALKWSPMRHPSTTHPAAGRTAVTLFVAFYYGCAIGLPFGSSCAASPRPNILFIMCDDHAYQAIGAYGSKINQTPNIDRLAAAGARFDRCYVTSSICAPSRACILTGKYGHKNGVRDNYTVFNGSQQTFPKLLQEAGYQTAIIGKWSVAAYGL